MPTKSRPLYVSSVLKILIYVALILITGIIAQLASWNIPHFEPFLVFVPTITYSAMMGGFLVGLITTIISVIIVILMLFYPATHPFLIADTSFFIQACILFFVGIFISYIIYIAKQYEKLIDYQKKLRQSHKLIETLEHNYELAQTEIKARDQFLAIASHELKTPVTSMLLEVQSAIHNIKNVSLANFSVVMLLKMLEDTEQQSKRLSKMVNDLLDLSLITTGKIDLEIEETNISKIVMDVAERFAVRLQDKKLMRIIINKPVIGFCDKLRLEQAVVNLISNAVKYGSNRPITVSVNANNDRARIIVSDQGIGIPPEQQKRIFNRFERAVASRDYRGLGVGLYITYQIVQAHNGKIHVESFPNKGSDFTIEIPLKSVQDFRLRA